MDTLTTMGQIKTIKLDEKMHARLSKHGSVGDTYQEVIGKLLDFYEAHSELRGKGKK